MLTTENNVEALLGTFEKVAEQEGWQPRNSAQSLTLFLMSEVQQAYHTLFLAKAEDYGTLKEEILACCGLSPTRAASKLLTRAVAPDTDGFFSGSLRGGFNLNN